MRSRKRNTTLSVAATPTFAEMLLAVWPRHTAKRAAAAANTSHRTGEGWVQRRREPSVSTAFQMARESAELRAAMILALAGDDYAEIIASLGGSQGASLRREVASVRGVACEPLRTFTVATGLMGSGK